MDKFNIELNEHSQKSIKAKISRSFIKEYSDFNDKPSINDIELVGNVTLSKLGIQPAGNYADNQRLNMLEFSIPTSVSQLLNDKNYQTYGDVVALIAAIPQFSIEVVEALPATGSKMVLYLVPKTTPSGDDIYDEYIWVETTSTFELVGTTAVDLSQYYTKTETDNLLNSKADKTVVETEFSKKQDISAKSDLYKINYEVVGNVNITPDGIASGFSPGSYLKTFIFKPDSNPWKMSGRVKCTNVSHYNVILWGGSYEKRLLLRYDEFKFFLGRQVPTLEIAPSSVIVNNQSIWFEVEYTGSQFIGRYKTNVDDEFVIHEIIDGWVFPQNNYQWWIGLQGSNNYQFDGDIYLNEFKIYIDGQLVYQPYVATGYASSKAVSDGYAELDAKIEELRALITGV